MSENLELIDQRFLSFPFPASESIARRLQKKVGMLLRCQCRLSQTLVLSAGCFVEAEHRHIPTVLETNSSCIDPFAKGAIAGRGKWAK